MDKLQKPVVSLIVKYLTYLRIIKTKKIKIYFNTFFMIEWFVFSREIYNTKIKLILQSCIC